MDPYGEAVGHPDDARVSLGRVLSKAINPNQLLILSEIARNSGSISSLLSGASERRRVPLSTLKLNARVLRDLGLISCGSASNPRPARLTEAGRAVLSMMSAICDENRVK
jgi:signal transduction histidine kinase